MKPNSEKILKILEEHGEISQPEITKLFDEENKDHKSENSKKVCVSFALKDLLKEGKIVLSKEEKQYGGIPTKFWKIKSGQ